MSPPGPCGVETAVKILFLKIGALLAFFGGPLVVVDLLRPHLPAPWDSVCAFAPVGLLVAGAASFTDEEQDAIDRFWMVVGTVGAVLLLGMNAFAIHHMETNTSDDRGLRILGLLVGTPCALYYVWRVLRSGRQRSFTPLPPEEVAARGASLDDWGLFVVGAAFVVLGLVVLPRKPQVGVVTIVFFGACAGLGWQRVRRRRNPEAARPESIPRGVMIRQSRRQLATLGTTLAIVGGTMAVVATEYPLLFRGLGAAIALVGVAALGSAVLGVLPAGYVCLAPEGLRVGRRKLEYSVPWQAMKSISAGELYGNAVVFVDLADAGSVTAAREDARRRALAELASAKRWQGSELVIMTSAYGLDASSFAAALAQQANACVQTRKRGPAPEDPEKGGLDRALSRSASTAQASLIGN